MKTDHADTPPAIEESPRAHYDTVGKAILTMGVIGSLVGTGLILFKDSHAGYIDGPSALGISAVMVILALWMIAHARTQVNALGLTPGSVTKFPSSSGGTWREPQ